jgi:hypothetical protein
MRIYYTSEVYTSKYRTASAFFGFSTMSKMTAATAAIMQDLRNAITANRITFNTATAYTSRYTAGTSPVFGV